MERTIERYLNDHLAGASGALLLIQEMMDAAKDPEACGFFEQLKLDVGADRELLEELLAAIGKEPSTAMKAAGSFVARVGCLKLAWDGFKPDSLGTFEALEVLALGIQGKRLLWRALGDISHEFPEWTGTDFRELEQRAIHQRDGVETRRLEAARQCLLYPRDESG